MEEHFYMIMDMLYGEEPKDEMEYILWEYERTQVLGKVDGAEEIKSKELKR